MVAKLLGLDGVLLNTIFLNLLILLINAGYKMLCFMSVVSPSHCVPSYLHVHCIVIVIQTDLSIIKAHSHPFARPSRFRRAILQAQPL